jgi:uncharacterized membrane protein YfcA
MLFLIIAGFTAGFIDAIVGGGGLISLPSLLMLGVPPQTALSSSKLIGVSTAIAGSFRYIHSKSVRWSGLKYSIPLAILGGCCGVLLTTRFSNESLKYIIFFGLIGIAIFLLLNKKFGLMEKKKGWSIYHLTWISFLVGAYDGFFGPGTGTLLVISLVHMFGYAFLPASATGRIINLAANVGALITFYLLGIIQLEFVIPAMVAAFAGGLLGASYAIRYGSKGIRPILFIVVFGLIIKLGISLY